MDKNLYYFCRTWQKYMDNVFALFETKNILSWFNIIAYYWICTYKIRIRDGEKGTDTFPDVRNIQITQKSWSWIYSDRILLLTDIFLTTHFIANNTSLSVQTIWFINSQNVLLFIIFQVRLHSGRKITKLNSHLCPIFATRKVLEGCLRISVLRWYIKLNKHFQFY